MHGPAGPAGPPAAMRDRGRLHELIEREQARLDASTPKSSLMYERAHEVLVGGVASSFQRRVPWPFYLVRGEGAVVWDLDGRRMVDFHNGFGSMVQGHANPSIAAAVRAQIGNGSHFAAPTEDAVIVAEELARRFGLPKWRYTNSGSESTMDAIRIARGFTGRDTIMKMVGSYHGHHDAVMVATGGDRDVPDEKGHWPSVSYGAGIPASVAELTVAVPFNDAPALERRVHELDHESCKPACLIIEPAMMLGMILPEPGYLVAVRDITRRHGIVLIFDEVKTGLAVAAGGVIERSGVRPDLVTLAKALGGGLPSGAIGGTEEVMSVVEDGSVYQVGTYNGNALTMAAARASLFEVLTPPAYAHLERLNQRMIEGCGRVLEAHRMTGYALGIGARGCVALSPTRIIDHATLAANQDPDLLRLTWLYAVNSGVFITPARPEQWTLSIAHSDEDVDTYVGFVERLLTDLDGYRPEPAG
jgi:glutamate-1-semialdehyde 2,1-aminomutase